MLRDLVAYLVALAKRWVLWAVLLLDLAGLVAVVVARPFEGSNTPRWIFLAVAAFGFAWTNFQLFRDLRPRDAVDEAAALFPRPDQQRRLDAVATVISIQSERALACLARAAADRSLPRDVRVRAGLALGRRTDARGEPGVLLGLNDSDMAIRQEAARAASAIGAVAARAQLARMVASEAEPAPRLAALEALSRLGVTSDQVPAVVSALQHPQTYKLAAAILVEMGDPRAIPGLERLVRSSDPTERATAVSALASFGEAAVDALVRNLDRRLDLEDAFVAIGDVAIPKLVDAAYDAPDDRARAAAVGVLGCLGPSALPHLIRLLHEPFPNQGQAIFSALTRQEADATTQQRLLVHTLLEIMETDPDRLRQRWAAGTLGRLGNPDAVEPLASLLVNDPDIVRRGWAAEALGEIGSPLAVKPLSAVLSSLDDVRHNTPEMGRHQKVVRALGRIGDPSGVPALEQVYQRARGGELEFLRHAIAQALREMSCEEAARARERLDIKEE